MYKFCCSKVKPYKSTYTDYEALFKFFLFKQLDYGENCKAPKSKGEFAIQFISQINFKSYTRKATHFTICQGVVKKIDEKEFKSSNYSRLNSFKNFKCQTHNKFFELNAYKKGSTYSNHHLSRTEGSTYNRDTTLDEKNPYSHKGKHWK